MNCQLCSLVLFLCVCVGRNLLFARKGKADSTNQKGMSDVLGWKLFSKIPPKLAQEKDASDTSLDYKQTRRLDTGKPEPEFSAKMMTNSALVRGQVARRSDKEVPSTTALILEHRPGLVLCCWQLSCFVYCTGHCYYVMQIQHDLKYRRLKYVI